MNGEFHNEGTARSLVDDLKEVLSEAVEASNDPVDDLSEADKGGKDLEKKAREKRKAKHLGAGRNPFKNKDHLGPGPRGSTNSKTDNWDCDCNSPYKCMCRNKKGRRKLIRIDRDYKKHYNSEYKRTSKGGIGNR